MMGRMNEILLDGYKKVRVLALGPIYVSLTYIAVPDF